MSQQRIIIYRQLIQQLLKCPSGEEPQILNDNSELLDPGLLQTIIVFAKLFDDDGEQDAAEFLTDLALQLGEFLGSDQQPTAIRKQAADILFKWGLEQAYVSQVFVALECWQQSLIIYQAIHDRQGEADSLGNLGNVYNSQGKYERAIAFLQKSLAISQEIKHRQGEATSLGNLGVAYNSIGQFEKAIAFNEKHLAISREIKDHQGEANALGNLGNAYHSLGQYERAIDFHKQSLAIEREIKNRQGEAASLESLGNAYLSLEQYEQAIDFHKQSLGIKREIKNSQGEANSLNNIGIAYNSLGQYEQAIDFYKQSLAIEREVKNRQGEADSLSNISNAYDSLGEYELAIDFYKKSLAISLEFKDRQRESNLLRGLGKAYHSLGQVERAIDFNKQSLTIDREIKDRRGESNSLGNLGKAYHSLGQVERAISLLEQSLAIKREIKDRQGEADCLGSLGNAYDFLGEYEQAIAFNKQSLAIEREIKDRQGEAISLGNLGITYYSLGQVERSMAFLEQSLAIKREIKDHQGEANSLVNLGNAYLSLGQYKQAINFLEQSLAICREIKNRKEEANYLGNLGNAYFSLGEYEKAIIFQEQCLAICREFKDHRGEAASLGSLGIAYDSLKQYEQAIIFQEQCLDIFQKIKNRQGEAVSLGNLGIVYHELKQTEKAIEKYRDCLKVATSKTMSPKCAGFGKKLGDIGFTQGDWHLALEGYESAMQAVEQLRKGSTTDKRRQEIIKQAISVYANAVQCYINLKQYDKAVETADRSRSRHLADLFASKDLYPQGEIPPEVEEYYRLQQQSNRLRFSDNDPMKPLATTRQQTPNGDAIIEKIKELEAEKQQAWLKIRSKDRVLAGQLQPDPLNFDQMQALIPDAETAILNFYTIGEHTHIFILRKNQSTKLYTCEGQGIESLQIWIFNNWLKLYKENPTAWQNQMGEFLSEIAKRLQINQLIDQHLNGIKELIIIPHLYLHQIPFAALPLNNIPIPHSDTVSEKTRGLMAVRKPSNTPAKKPPQQPEYLSDRFRLRIVPSCQILSFCHQRGNLKPATMGIVENATGDLLFTGYECETLATMHKVTPNSRLQYQQATISNYQKLLNQVEVLHSSHHASSQLDNSLESKLLLFDGDINLGRIFTWRFSDLAEVFLSCCETNLTLTQITDDPLSIASGFLCAGARNVVSTLWAVDDLATALFCILYYQEKQDKSRSEAIRQAQFKLRNLTGDELSGKYKRQLEDYFARQQSGENKAEILKNVRVRLDLLCRETLPFVSPYYWSGFVSQGLA